MTPLAKKLTIKPDQRLLALNAPEGFDAMLDPLPSGTTLETAPEPGVEYDGVYLFARDAEEAAELAPIALAAIRYDGSFWGIWPKENAKRKRDLTRDMGWEPLHGAKLTPVTSVSINDEWSSLRWRPVERVGK